MSEVPTVTLSVIEYNRLRQIEDARAAEILELQRQLEDARLGAADSEARQLHVAFTHAFRIVRFAIGNLPVLTVRGWPYEDLDAIAKMLPTMPLISEYDREISTDLRLFAADAKIWEGHRAAGREQEVLREENLARQARTPAEGNPFGETLFSGQTGAGHLRQTERSLDQVGVILGASGGGSGRKKQRSSAARPKTTRGRRK